MNKDKAIDFAMFSATILFLSVCAGVLIYRIITPRTELFGASYIEPTAEYVYIKGSGELNINTATMEELMTLPGIGETRASQIIKYRTYNGDFKSITDLMLVTGIGEGIYNEIKDLICI